YNIKPDLNFELNGTDLIVKNLTYFNKIEFNNLDNLFNEIQKTIKDNKFTSEEFNQFVTNDNEEFKTLIANNLYFSPTEQFSVDNIENINFDVNSTQLEITLSGNYLKYEISQTNPDISLNDRTLIINNLRFYELIDFGYVRQLGTGIQDDITARKYTQEEFQWYVNNIGNQEYKEYISNQLHISPNVKLPIEYIIDLKVNDNYQLEVILDDDFKKYTVSPDNNISVENDNLLLIQDLVYYSSINISNLNEAYTYIQNLILDNSLSWDDFNSYIKNNLSTIKQELGSRIKISNTETIGANEIKGISINSSHNFEITLNSVNKKYTIEEFEHASLSDTTITFKNLEFYTNIKLSNLSNLRNQINDLIFYKNSFSQSDFINYIKNNQTSLKNLVSSSTNKLITGTGSWNVNQITNIECINGSLKITLTPPQHYKYSIESYSYASLSNNVLTITNLNFYNPTPSSYFTWNGSIITGLTTSGLNQTNIIIPNNCTELAANSFKDNRRLISITIPKSVKIIRYSTFEGCVYLENVQINEGLEIIEGWTFKWCALRSLSLPSTLTQMHNNVLDNNRYLPRVDFYSTWLDLWDRACSCLNGILSSVYFHNITDPNHLTIHEWCFADNTNNTSIWARSNVADYLASRNNLKGIYHYYRL
ncbi:MAG: leucine-rich repeat domain-containing protein, partial [Ureaplasma sp.]|nr:leucine-rich repeat domain-containing protein [Ureaplasma sp.]